MFLNVGNWVSDGIRMPVRSWLSIPLAGIALVLAAGGDTVIGYPDIDDCILDINGHDCLYRVHACSGSYRCKNLSAVSSTRHQAAKATSEGCL